MKTLIYHAGFIGDIIVCGQNFALELLARNKHQKVDIIIQEKVSHVSEIISPLNIFNNIIFGNEETFNKIKDQYSKSYIMDGNVFPEGNLRTPFTHAGIPFKQHHLKLKLSKQHKAVADKITQEIHGKIIIMQDDMDRKWDSKNVRALKSELEKIATVITVGPSIIHKNHPDPLSFLESVALIEKSEMFVGIDSGIAHGAALIGIKTILIPPVFPEHWISPTEYANPFTENKHISVRPPQELFCGNYLCLKSNSSGGLKHGCGHPLHVKSYRYPKL